MELVNVAPFLHEDGKKLDKGGATDLEGVVHEGVDVGRVARVGVQVGLEVRAGFYSLGDQVPSFKYGLHIIREANTL